MLVGQLWDADVLEELELDVLIGLGAGAAVTGFGVAGALAGVLAAGAVVLTGVTVVVVVLTGEGFVYWLSKYPSSAPTAAPHAPPNAGLSFM